MLVETTEAAQAALRKFFSELGYRVLITENPQRALVRFSTTPLPADCLVISSQLLGEAAIDIVLIQPTAGVALLEIEPRWTPDALEGLRARLQQSGFLAAYPGHLPMIHRRLEPAHVGQLGEILSEAFIWQPPLTLFGPGAWHEALERVLTPGFGGEPVAPPADATTVLEPGSRAIVDAIGNLRVTP
jgi:hypothetical protein